MTRDKQEHRGAPQTGTTVSMPFILGGKQKSGREITVKVRTREGELDVEMPEITDQDLELLSNTQDIHELSVKEIVSFYSEVGELWSRRDYGLRKESVRLAEELSGYSEAMIEHSYDQIAGIFSAQYAEQTLKAEMHDENFLDDWIEVNSIFVHAQPRGRVLHMLAGNAPPICAVSMLRGSLTKNSNTVKMASGDLVTPTHLAMSFKDVDPDHPITKTTSVVYWKHESPLEDRLIHAANAICVWGGQDVIDLVRSKSRHGTEVLEFGPRRSMQLVGRETFESRDSLRSTADNAAHDLVLFDQEACHSPQLAFVEGAGNAEKFCEALAVSLDEEGKRLPKGFTHKDKHASISHERLLAKFYGEKVYESKGTEWTIIISDKVKRTQRHPLGRTLYVFEVNDLKDAVQYIDKSVQTVAIHPSKRIAELRDELTRHGADRITHVGKMGYFATGAPHEGIYPLSRLVRWVKSR